jgi:predicted AlkP superfamily phosphohydrolase/phosphomutase
MYQLGLSGIYINKKGREAGGIVKSEEYRALKKELKERLEAITHPETGEKAITTVYDTEEIGSGPYTEDAPDLIIGYNIGYRASWDAAVGKSSETVVEDNVKSWSGDHCIDWKLVPGVIFASRKLAREKPGLIDIGPSILELFGVAVPEYMLGRSIFRTEPGEASPHIERGGEVSHTGQGSEDTGGGDE